MNDIKISKEELIEEIEKVHEICDNRITCNGCPYRTIINSDYRYCKFMRPPEEWNLTEIRDTINIIVREVKNNGN